MNMQMAIEFDRQSAAGAVAEFNSVLKALEIAADKFSASVGRQFDLFMSGMATDVLKTWNDAEKTVVDSTKNALKGTVSAAFDGEMDKVGDIWEKSWDDMGTKLEGLWDKLLGAPLDRALTGVQNMFKELVFDPVSDWFTGLFSGDGWAKAAPAEATFTPA